MPQTMMVAAKNTHDAMKYTAPSCFVFLYCWMPMRNEIMKGMTETKLMMDDDAMLVPRTVGCMVVPQSFARLIVPIAVIHN
jgi:hypothetical protein